MTVTCARASQANTRGCPSAIRRPNAASCVDMPRFARSETAAAARQRRPPCDERLRKPVLRRVDEAVDPAQKRRPASLRLGLGGGGTRQSLGVEVEAEHACEPEEAGECERRLPGRPGERGEQRRVHEEVDLGVQVPAEGARPAGETRELAVRVVEQRFQLDKERGGEQRAARRARHAAARPAPPAATTTSGGGTRRRAKRRTSGCASGRKTLSHTSSVPRRGLRDRARALDGKGCPLRPGSARVRRRACPTRSRAARRAVCRPRRT